MFDRRPAPGTWLSSLPFGFPARPVRRRLDGASRENHMLEIPVGAAKHLAAVIASFEANLALPQTTA